MYIPPRVQIRSSAVLRFMGQKGLWSLFLFLSLFQSSLIIAKQTDEIVPEVQYSANSPELLRLQSQEKEWKMDMGSSLQVQELLEALRAKNAELSLKYADDPASFKKVLSNKNVAVKKDYGSATRIQLKLSDNKVHDVVVVSLSNSKGEPVDVIVANLNTLDPETPELHVLIADRIVYEPSNPDKSRFGKSVLLLDTDWLNPTASSEATVDTLRQIFFKKGSTLRAWVKATIFQPKMGNLIFNAPITALQMGAAGMAGYLANDIFHISSTPWHMPTVLCLVWSTIIGAHLDTYTALVKKGGRLKRFAFNFFGTSMSYAVTLGMWSIAAGMMATHGYHSYSQLSPQDWMHVANVFISTKLLFTVINGLAGNMVKAAVYDFAHFRGDVGMVQGDFKLGPFRSSRANWHRELYYSLIANPLRLVDLVAKVKSKSGDSGNALGISVKAAFLMVAGISHWCMTRYAETLAASARNNPEFAKKVDVKVATETAIKLRKGIEEFKVKLLKAPSRFTDYLLGRTLENFNHKEVNKLFQAWLTASSAYTYRFENREQVPTQELSYYRESLAQELVDLSLASSGVHKFTSDRNVNPRELYDFTGKGAAKLIGSLKYEAAKLVATSSPEMAQQINEYSLLLQRILEVSSEKLSANKKLSNHAKLEFVSFAHQLVRDFPTNVSEYGRDFLNVKFAERFGALSVKAVEHFSARLVLWRYLYRTEVPKELRDPFVHFINSSEVSELKTWLNSEKSRYDTLKGNGALANYVSVYRKELGEVNSLIDEMNRRVAEKKKRLGRVVTAADISIFSEEFLAYKAFMDYKASFESRWVKNPDVHVVPDTMWSYAQKKASLKLSKRPGGSACLRQLLGLRLN